MNKSSPKYGSVVVIDESTAVDPNISWVQANVVEVKDYHHPSKSDEYVEGVAVDEISSQPKFRDLPFAILFLLHLGVISFIALACGTFDGLVPAQDSDIAESTANAMMNDPTTREWIKSVISVLIPMVVSCIMVSFLTSHLITGILVVKYPTTAVTISLYSSIITNIAFMLMLLAAYPNIWVFLLSIIVLAWSIWFVFAVKEFIPFAAATLKLALAGITANWGIYIFSLILSALSCLWIVAWVYVANGIGFFQDVDALSEEGRGKEYYTRNNTTYYTSYYVGDGKVCTIILMLLSLYWTSIVIVNVMQTTTAGVIGTFVFENPSSASCCSTAVTQSIIRSCTYSLGSICFGSLLNAILITLRVILDWARQTAREDGDGGAALLYCVLQCIVSLFEDIMEYFNQWAYVFVGIYGTSYLKSGKAVMELFRARGCTSIISDSLVIYVLNAVMIVVGLVCGVLAWVVDVASSSTHVVNPWVAFWIGFVVGIIISSAMMNVVQGAVKAIIVCYFDHPGKMYQNHPRETEALSDAIDLLFPQVTSFAFTNDNFTV